MEINWKTIWNEFENELSNRLQEGVLNEWSMQAEIIERIIERHMAQHVVKMKADEVVLETGKYYWATEPDCSWEDTPVNPFIVLYEVILGKEWFSLCGSGENYELDEIIVLKKVEDYD